MSDVASPALANASASQPESERSYLRLHHATIFVRDQDQSLQFYVETLGFTLVVDYRFGTSRFILVSPPDGTALLALVAPRQTSEADKHLTHPGQIVFVSDDIFSTFNAWSARGVRFLHPPKAESWGGTSTTFEDPDGNQFGLAAWDDLSREVEARRRQTAEQLESERRRAQEVEIARQVQARLFPQTAPSLATLDYAGVCLQARDVGGDYYDFIRLGQDRLGLVIGDISGKGIAAALLMANLQANLRSQAAMAVDHLQRFLKSINRVFFENTVDSAYATLFYAEYDDSERRIRYANCGHLPALLLRRDHKVERLESTGTVVGLFGEWDCAIENCTLGAGDTLVLYTDGITESFNDAGEDFGEQRLVQTLMRHGGLASEAMLAAVVEEVRRFGRPDSHDDMTLIIAKCRGDS